MGLGRSMESMAAKIRSWSLRRGKQIGRLESAYNLETEISLLPIKIRTAL